MKVSHEYTWWWGSKSGLNYDLTLASAVLHHCVIFWASLFTIFMYREHKFNYCTNKDLTGLLLSLN